MKIYKQTITELQLKKSNGDLHKAKITSSKDAYDYFKAIYDSELLEICESFIVIYLNQANNTIGYFKASQGGIAGTVVDVRLILKKALDCYATGMIISHNHPSGNLKPSDEDNKMTEKIKSAGLLMDIRLFDHIIITNEGYYSYGDEGKI